MIGLGRCSGWTSLWHLIGDFGWGRWNDMHVGDSSAGEMDGMSVAFFLLPNASEMTILRINMTRCFIPC